MDLERFYDDKLLPLFFHLLPCYQYEEVTSKKLDLNFLC